MTTYFSIIKRLFIYPEMACFGVYLTPLIPLSFSFERENTKKRGEAPLRHLIKFFYALQRREGY